MKKYIALAAIAAASFLVSASPAVADGCYICTTGSSDACKNYCRYSGSDTQANRDKCKKAGCKIGGTASCSTAANVKICSATAPANPFARLAVR